MTPSEFQQLVLRLSHEPNNPRRLSRFTAQWDLLATELRRHLPEFTDALYASWPAPELAGGLADFLARLEAVVAPDPAAPSWQLQPTEIADLRRDCIAVAAQRLYVALTAAREGINEASLAALSILAQLTPAAPAEYFAAAWRLQTAEYQALREQMGARVAAQALGESAAITLALFMMMVAEERTLTVEPVWALAAGRKGGVGRLDVAVLAPHDAAPGAVELAPWSRYRIAIATAERLRAQVGPLAGLADGARLRIAFNPPGIAPAEPGAIGVPDPPGESIGLALALACYAAGANTVLGRYAVTGEVGEDLRVLAVEGVGDKLEKLAAFNLIARQPIYNVLLPERNMTHEISAVAERHGLRLNMGLRGPVRTTDLPGLLQPGLLADGLHDYVARLLDRQDDLAATFAAPGAPYQNSRWPLAERLLDQIAGFADAHTVGPRSTSFILPLPYGSDAAPAVAYIAAVLARRRQAWMLQLAQAGTASGKPPAPVILSAVATGDGFGPALEDAIADVVGSDALRVYVRDAWRALPGEFVLILRGDDDLVWRQIIARGGWLDEVQGRGAAEGRQFLILLANSLEQMRRWARDLERQGEEIDPPPPRWYF